MTHRAQRARPAGKGTYSPLFDELTPELGLIAAAVYGVVWRHCQLRDGVCRASTRRMASLIGCDRMTVKRHLDWLVSAGYLEDDTPGLRNRPHIYRVIEEQGSTDPAPEGWEE